MLSKSRTTLVIILATSTLLLASACSKHAAGTGSQNTASPTPGHFATSDLAKLRWIEGTWRGTGVDQAPFYERYRFENDSTLVVETFDSDKYDKVTDTSRFELKDGQFGEGTRSAATEIDDSSIIFYPLTKGNSWCWKRESKDVWQAIVDWPVGHRVYRMERWTPSKAR